MNKTREIFFLGLFIGGMSLAMYFSPVWYFFPVIMGTYISLWYRGITHRQYLVPVLFCGEICCAVAWFSSPWLAWIIQAAIFGIFLHEIKIQDTQQERISFITLCGSLAVVTFLSDLMNHTFIIIFIVMCISIGVILFIFMVEYRLQKKYSGEKI